MSHGNMEKCEPNLTPMLDMVLQLVMFFMLCANFVTEEVNGTIELPKAIAAKPLDKRDDKIIFLNVDSKGDVLLSLLDTPEGQSSTLKNKLNVQSYLKRKAAADAQSTKPGDPPLRSVVIIRADKKATFEKVNDVMDAVRGAGYTQVRLRVVADDDRK